MTIDFGVGLIELERRKKAQQERIAQRIMDRAVLFDGATPEENEIVATVEIESEDMVNDIMTEDVVNHPTHYNQYEGFEVIDVCEQLRSPDGSGGYNRGNAFKYLARAGWKNPDKELEDLKKAMFYIQREIERVEKKPQDDETPALHLCRDCGSSLNISEKRDRWYCRNETCGKYLLRVTADGYSYPIAHENATDSLFLFTCPTCNSLMQKSPKHYSNTMYRCVNRSCAAFGMIAEMPNP